ncbi:MAG TPA: hypothetical protein ENG33_02395 [Chloroflexi bacterium]|nr:hypothetical protein [Chloroflexota bacterium]
MLVGGASLRAKDFVEIVQMSAEVRSKTGKPLEEDEG